MPGLNQKTQKFNWDLTKRQKKVVSYIFSGLAFSICLAVWKIPQKLQVNILNIHCKMSCFAYQTLLVVFQKNNKIILLNSSKRDQMEIHLLNCFFTQIFKRKLI